MTITLKREYIIKEVKNRLSNDGSGEGRGLRRVVDPDTSSSAWNIGSQPIWIGIKNKPYPPTKSLPQIFILPWGSSLDREKENKPYIERMSLGVEIFIKNSNKFNSHEFGDYVLARIQEAVELDKRFKKMVSDSSDPDYGNLIHGTELVDIYGTTDREVIEMANSTLYISAGFDFKFYENFLGVRSPV